MPTPIRQLNSQTAYLADGETTVWNFSFSGGYILPEHVKARTRAPDDTLTELAIDYEEDFVGPYQLRITPAVTDGYELLIYRDTPKDLPLVDFQDGTQLPEANLDIVARQSIFVAAESADWLGVTTTADLTALAVESGANAAAAAASALAAAASAAGVTASVDAAEASAAEAAASALAASASAATAGAAADDLADELATSDGPGLIGFDWSETYPEGTLGFVVKDRETSIMKFLTAAQKADVLARTAALDLTTPMTTAALTGERLYYPGGKYKFSRIASGIAAGGMRGDGWDRTILVSTDTSGNNLFTFTGGAAGSAVGGVMVSDLQVIGALSGLGVPAKSGGAAFAIDAATDENAYSNFTRVMITYLPIGIDFIRAALWKVTDCDFLAYTVAGIQVANLNVADSGDSSVKGCVFNNPYTTGSGIWQKSSGGLKVVGNKFLGGARGYTMALEGSTSVLLISANSFENMAQQGIVLAQQTVGANFVNVAITGNEFSVGAVAIATDASGFLSEVNISGNQINMGATGSNACIALNNVTDFHIGANLIKGNGGVGSSAINITNCTTGKIGPNTYSNLPNPLSVTGSPTVVVHKDDQSGTAVSSTSGWAAYAGGLYRSALVTVTFPQPFLHTPAASDVYLTCGALNGEVGAVINSVSETQLSFYAVSAVTGIAATINWSVRGTL